MESVESKAKSTYHQYGLAKEHFNAASVIESIYRKGFIMGYHTARDEIENEENPAGHS